MSALVLAALVIAGAAPEEAAIRALYKSFDEAFEKKEVDAFEALFAPDYVASFADGSTNGRDETLADIREEAEGALAPIHCKEQLKKVVVEGETATTQVLEETGYQVRGGDGRLHSYRYTESYEDHLSKRDGRWLFATTRYEAGGDEQLDGKTIARGELKKALAALGGAGDRESALRDVYRRAGAAFEKKDLAALKDLYSPDWTVVSGADATPAGAALAALTRESAAALPPVHRQLDLRRVTVDGDSASVELLCETSYAVKGSDGKVHQLHYKQPTVDQLTFADGHWRLQASQLLDGAESTWDGAPMDRSEIGKRLGR